MIKEQNNYDETYDKIGKYCLNLGYIFDHAEMRFLINIAITHEMTLSGNKTIWNKGILMGRMNIKTSVFNRCAKKMIELKLLEVEKIAGKRYSYSLNIELYERLILIVNASDDFLVVKEFFKKNFIDENRSITDITDEEIEQLKEAKGYQWGMVACSVKSI